MYPRSLEIPSAGRQSFFLFGPRGTGKTTLLEQRFPDAVHLDLLDHALYLELLARPQRLRDLIPPGYERMGCGRRSAADASGPQRGPPADRDGRAALHPDRVERSQPAPAGRQPAGRPSAHPSPVPADGGRSRQRLRVGAGADPRPASVGVHPAGPRLVPGIVRRELPPPGSAGRRTHPQPCGVQPVPGKRQLLAGGAPQRGRGGARRGGGPQDGCRLLRPAGRPADRDQGPGLHQASQTPHDRPSEVLPVRRRASTG